MWVDISQNISYLTQNGSPKFLSIEKVREAYDPLLLSPADSFVALWVPLGLL